MSESVIRRILMQHKDLSRDKVLGLIEKKKADSGGFLSDQGAAMLVAQDFNVEVGQAELAEIQIKDMVSGLSDVTLTGRVMAVSALQEFKRRDGSSGKVLRFTLGDSTGEVNCVAWDRQAEGLTNQPLQDRIVTISHGYTREGLGGNVELSIGDRSEVQLEQNGSKATQQLADQFTSIADAPESEGEVHVVGIIKTPPRVTEFRKADGMGKVLRTRLIDETGRITLVAWNERTDDLHDAIVGKAVRVSGGRIRTSINGSPEIHVDSMSKVEVLDSTPAQLVNLQPSLLKISEIRANTRDIDLLAKVLNVQQPVEVKRSTGGTTKVMRLLLGDDTGLLQASLWDDKAELDLKVGQTVLIEDATSRERLGEVSISAGKMSAITVRPGMELEASHPAPSNIAKLQQGGSPVVVEGRLVNQPAVKQVQTSRGDIVELTEIQLRDDSGECRVVFWRDLARRAAELKQGSAVRVIGASRRLGFKGGVELSSGPLTYFEISELAPSSVDRIIGLTEGVEAALQGIILELSSASHASLICRKCGSRIEHENDATTCSRCKSSEDIGLSVMLFIRVDDGSGQVDVIIESPESNAILAKDIKWIMRNLIEKKAPRMQLTVETLSRLIGMKVLAKGILSRDSATGKSVFQVEEIREVTASGGESPSRSNSLLG